MMTDERKHIGTWVLMLNSSRFLYSLRDGIPQAFVQMNDLFGFQSSFLDFAKGATRRVYISAGVCKPRNGHGKRRVISGDARI